MRIFQYILVLSFFLISENAFSLSCHPYSEKVIGECSQEGCKKILYVQDVKSFGACGRRPVISNAPDWAKLVLEDEFKEKVSFDGSQVIEVSIPYWFWPRTGEGKSYDVYKTFKNNRAKSEYDPPYLKIIKDKNFQEVLIDWEKEEVSNYQRNLLLKIADWFSFIVSLVVLLVTIKWFRNRLINGEGEFLLIAAFAIQITLFTLGVLIIGSWETFLLALHLLIIPIIWLYEVIYSIVFVVQNRRRD